MVFLLLLTLGAVGIYNVFKWKDTSGAYFSSMDQMYSLPKNVADVAFFGPSTVYSDFNPAVFWEESGIASFNAGISSQDREASYYFIKEFLKRQSPKVVVLDATLFQIDHYEVQGNIYRNTLSMRNSKNFTDVVNTIVPDNDKTGTNTLWDYYLRWPIIHNRYKEIEKNDFVPVPEYEKCLGYRYQYDGNGLEPTDTYFDHTKITEISEGNKAWIDKVYKLSKEEGFEIVVVQLPQFIDEEQRAEMNGNLKYLDELGIKNIDLNLYVDEMGFDYVNDMCDGAHAKTSGANKISSFICKYLSDNFDLADRRGTAGYGLFDDAAEVNRHEKLCRQIEDCDDPAGLFELIGNGDGLITLVTLREGSAGITEEASAILGEYMSDKAIWSGGGTAVSDNGNVTEITGGKAYALKLNKSEYLQVSPISNGSEHWDKVYFGSTLCEFGSGNFMAVYDKVLDKLVTVREIF